MATLDLEYISRLGPGEGRLDKEALLQQDCILVHSLRRVWPSDPDWVVALLRRHAGTLRELQLGGLNRKLLLQVAQLPGLRKLDLWWVDDDLLRGPPLPEDWDCQLRWLKLHAIPRKVTQHLLSTHRHSLEVLELRAGTGPKTGRREKWPNFVVDLPPLFDCGLHRLRYLSLERYRPGCDPRCYAQLCAVRAVLPSCTVKCTHCMEQYH